MTRGVARFRGPDGTEWTTDRGRSDFDRTRAIRKKILEGYRPVAWDRDWQSPRAWPPRELTLEARLTSDENRIEDFLVYSDWLQAAGNPRGALIAVQHRLASLPAGDPARAALEAEERALLDAHREALLGPLAAIDPAYLQLEWHLGFIRGARIHRTGYIDAQLPLAEEVLWHLLDEERAPFLERLTLGLIEWGDQDNQAVVTLLQDPPFAPPPLRVLRIGAFGGDDLFDRGEIDISRAWLAPLTRLSALYPRLEELELTGRLNGRMPGDRLFGDLELPSLRRFTFRTGGLPVEHLEELRRARWPRLESLDLWFGDEDYGGTCTVDDVLPLLDGRAALPPSLVRLGLRNASFADALVEPLLASPLLPRLRALDLSLGVLTDDGAALLARGRDRLAHLERLDLRDNCLSSDGVALVRDLCREVITIDNDPGFRYVSVSE